MSLAANIAALAAAVRDKLNLKLDSAPDRATLAVSSVGVGYRYLREAGREGWFKWDGAVAIATHQADTQQGLYVAPNAAAVGAWVRQHNGTLQTSWFGAVGNAIADDTVCLQAMLDCAGSHYLRFEISKIHVCAGPLYIRYHYLTGRCVGYGQIRHTGTGAVIRTQRVGTNYPVSCNLSFNIELTGDGQAGWDLEISSSQIQLLIDMNDPACTNCVGMNMMGDETYGSGSYYNTIMIRGQGAHQTNTHLIRTVNSAGNVASSRGPNNNTVIIERAGQYNVAIYDRVGGGNRFDVRACEALASATSVCIRAGHDTNSSNLCGNVYAIQYTENVDTVFESLAGTFGSGCYLNYTYATGGQAITDPVGILREIHGVPGFYYALATAQPFVTKTSGANYPQINGVSPYLQFTDTVTGKAVLFGTSHSYSTATHILQWVYNGVAMLRIGLSRLSPVTNAMMDLGAAAERFNDAYIKTLRPGDGTVKWTSGAGSPEGVVIAGPGSIYGRTDGGIGTTIYFKESGTGATGWVAK